MATHKNSKLAFKRGGILGRLYGIRGLANRNLNDVLSVSEIIKLDEIAEKAEELISSWDKHYISNRYKKEKS